MFCNRNEEMMVEKCPPRVVEMKYGGAIRMLTQKRKPLPLRNEAQLNCVSLRSQLDCEVNCGAVKGQDERRHSAAVTKLESVLESILLVMSGRSAAW